MPKISGYTTEAPGSTSDLIGNVGSTTKRFNVKQVIDSIVAAAGDLIYGKGAGDSTVLSIGTSGQVLQSSGGIPAWVDQSDLTGTPDPSTGHVTTAGSSGQIPQTTGGAFAWRGVDAVLADLGPPTTAGGKLVAKSSVSVGFIDDDWSVTVSIQESTIAAGIKATFKVPWTAGIEGVELALNTTATSQAFIADVYVDDFSSTPATSGSKITASAPPTISTGNQRSSDGTLTGWTTLVTVGDHFTIAVTQGSSGVSRADLTLFGKKLSTA